MIALIFPFVSLYESVTLLGNVIPLFKNPFTSNIPYQLALAFRNVGNTQ